MNSVRNNNRRTSQIDKGLVIKYLVHLFHDRGLRTSTVTHLKLALAVPLRLGHKIDLSDQIFTDLIKAMWKKRSNPPTPRPSWDLNRVLRFIDELPAHRSEERELQVCAFLLLLATGWRVSELHACVRQGEYCRVIPPKTQLIRPHLSFLAKNECPK